MGNFCNSEEALDQRKRDSYRPRKLSSELEEQQLDQEATEEISFKKKCGQVWRTFDIDQSGKLEREEAKNFLRNILPELLGEEGYKPNEDLVRRFITILDLNQDGLIDQNEFY